MIRFVYISTQDKLRLLGVHYEPSEKETCVLLVHGMAGNIIENEFGNILGELLENNNYGFVYAHNRGYSQVNDISVNVIDSQNAFENRQVGAVYERFEDCLLDVDAWVKEVFRLGYKRIVLAGHSLGCNKIIHYIYKKKPSNLTGVIFLSPPDMVANGKESGLSKVYDSQLIEAKKNIKEGNPRKLLSDLLWSSYTLSSQTFLDMFEDGCPADNLPIMRNPESFPELESIHVPILAIVGEFDDIVVRTLKEDMDLLAKKAANAPSFTKVHLQGATHRYDNRENELSDEVLKWLSANSL